MPKHVQVREIRKIARLLEYPRPNLPVPAVLVTCCLIDWLAKAYAGTDCARFREYIKARMPNTFRQLQFNDLARRGQIAGIDCSVHPRPDGKWTQCSSSIDILYRHVRCGLVHDYYESADCRIMNRGNERYRSVIVDYQNQKYIKYALVLNAPCFIREFLATL
jgi:hypothetical protein